MPSESSGARKTAAGSPQGERGGAHQLLKPHATRGSVGPVDKEDIVGAVEAWLPALGLPEAPAAGVRDLAGRSIRIAKFTDEETSRFFFPWRTLLFQMKMQQQLGVILRKRGAKILSVRPTAEDYARWLESEKKSDSAELRFHFASQPPEDPS